MQRIHKEFILSKQLLKSGTSVGANVEEGVQAQSRPDFISKMNIALKEAQESRYWIRLLRDTSLVEGAEANALVEEINEIIRILVKILKTTKANVPL